MDIKVEFMCHHVEERRVVNQAHARKVKESARGNLCTYCAEDYDAHNTKEFLDMLEHDEQLTRNRQ